ncbi:MAG TPA: CHASE2 domain-containing protein, partial [Chitinophagaceae bacterium]|nr:CHASE2 domain-containing protein [Chitinophagaceae bacterium]
ITGELDPDIVLVNNIEEGDRTFLGKLLLKIDSLKPIVIGIDVLLDKEKDSKQDSILIAALKKINNDILVYSINQNEKYSHSRPEFTSLVDEEGFLKYEKTFGLVSNMTPIIKLENEIQESFALKIVKHWKINFLPNINVNQTIPIDYTRTIKQILHIDGTELLSRNIDDFDMNNKVILLGYTGPGSEDKYSTPLRFLEGEKDHDEPDTYGLIIIANEIRTLLKYEKRD